MHEIACCSRGAGVAPGAHSYNASAISVCAAASPRRPLPGSVGPAARQSTRRGSAAGDLLAVTFDARRREADELADPDAAWANVSTTATSRAGQAGAHVDGGE